MSFGFDCPVTYRCWLSPLKVVHLKTLAPISYWGKGGQLGPMLTQLVAEVTALWSFSETPEKLPGCLAPILPPEECRQVMVNLAQNTGRCFQGTTLISASTSFQSLMEQQLFPAGNPEEQARSTSSNRGGGGGGANKRNGSIARSIQDSSPTTSKQQPETFSLVLDIGMRPPRADGKEHDALNDDATLTISTMLLACPVTVRTLLDCTDPHLGLVCIASHIPLSHVNSGKVERVRKLVASDVDTYLARGTINSKGTGPRTVIPTQGATAPAIMTQELKRMRREEEAERAKFATSRVLFALQQGRPLLKPSVARFVLPSLVYASKFYVVGSRTVLRNNFPVVKLLPALKSTRLVVDLGRKDMKEEVKILNYLDGAHIQPEEISLFYHRDIATPRTIHYDLLCRGLLLKKSHLKTASLVLGNGQEFTTPIRRSGLQFDSHATLKKLSLPTDLTISIKWMHKKYAPTHNSLVYVWHQDAHHWLRVVVPGGASVLQVKRQIRTMVGPNFPVDRQELVMAAGTAASVTLKNDHRVKGGNTKVREAKSSITLVQIPPPVPPTISHLTKLRNKKARLEVELERLDEQRAAILSDIKEVSDALVVEQIKSDGESPAAAALPQVQQVDAIASGTISAPPPPVVDGLERTSTTSIASVSPSVLSRDDDSAAERGKRNRTTDDASE